MEDTPITFIPIFMFYSSKMQTSTIVTRFSHVKIIAMQPCHNIDIKIYVH